jgi:hypothetical protein
MHIATGRTHNAFGAPLISCQVSESLKQSWPGLTLRKCNYLVVVRCWQAPPVILLCRLIYDSHLLVRKSYVSLYCWLVRVVVTNACCHSRSYINSHTTRRSSVGAPKYFSGIRSESYCHHSNSMCCVIGPITFQHLKSTL